MQPLTTGKYSIFNLITMELKSSCTIEVIKYRNKYLFCVLKVAERDIVYFHGQNEPHKTHRWLETEQWAAFDAKLQELVEGKSFKRLKKTLNFRLTNSVDLQITKSTIPVDLLCKIVDFEITPDDVFAAIECNFKYVDTKTEQSSSNSVEPQEEQLPSSRKMENLEKITLPTGNLYKYHKNVDEKKQQRENKTSQTEHVHLRKSPRKERERHQREQEQTERKDEKRHEHKIHKDCKTPAKELVSHNYHSLHKEPTTPLKVKLHRFAIDEEDGPENVQKKYSPKKAAQEETKRTAKENIATRSQTQRSAALRYCYKSAEIDKKVLKSISDCEEDFSQRKKKKKLESHDYLSDSSIDSKEGLNTDLLNSNTDQKPANNDKERCKSTVPTTTVLNGKKDFESAFSKIKSISPSPTSKRTLKRKTVRNIEETTESRKMDEWLGKSPLLKKEKIESRVKPNNLVEIFNLNVCTNSNPSSNEEKEKQLQLAKARTDYNREVAQLLKDLTPKCPDKIKILDLLNLSSNDVLKTFKQYEPQLESLFLEYRSKTRQRRNNGVDHFLVMGLLSNATEQEMMNTLSEHYEKNREGLPKYGELFSMVLMPEWILSIFMKHHRMTREKAIEHIKAQNAYKMYTQPEVNMDDSMFP